MVQFVMSSIDKVVKLFYHCEVHSKHEKIAKNTSLYCSTSSGFLQKPYPDQVRILTVDTLLVLINFALLLGIKFSELSNMNSQIVLDLFLSFVLVDLSSGLIHLFLDQPSTKNHRFSIVRQLALQFQDHHDKPYDNTLPPAYHIVFNFTVATIPLIMIFWLTQVVTKVNFYYYSIFTFLFMCIGQYSHRNCHLTDSERMWVCNTLVKANILMNPKNHHKHHKTFDCEYAILSGWTNPLIHALTKCPGFGVDNPRWGLITLSCYIFVMPLAKVFLHYIAT